MNQRGRYLWNLWSFQNKGHDFHTRFPIKNENKFKLYADGVSRVRNFIHSEKYNMTSATRDAAKVAYVAACVMKGVNAPERYSAENASLLRPTKITAGTFSRVNNLRNSIPEAFFYWSKVAELLG